MIWYTNELEIDDKIVSVLGTIKDSVLMITVNNEVKFQKPLNMWAYQEILPEDVLIKYEGKIRKIESKIPDWIATGRLVI